MEIRKQEADYNMIDWWKKVLLDNYANFEGRARRSEYWYYALVNFLVIMACYIIIGIGAVMESQLLAIVGASLVGIYALATLIPSLAVAVRRLHDTNKSGWLLLIGLIPLAGLVLLVFYCTEGDRGNNQYGSDPKEIR